MDTLRLVDEARFASAFSFKYSSRPGTPAADLEDHVPEETKSERLARLQERVETHRQAFNRGTIGRTVDVLLEKPGRHAGQLAGKSPYLQPVQMQGEGHAVGEVVSARITGVSTNSLFGEAVAAEPASAAA